MTSAISRIISVCVLLTGCANIQRPSDNAAVHPSSCIRRALEVADEYFRPRNVDMTSLNISVELSRGTALATIIARPDVSPTTFGGGGEAVVDCRNQSIVHAEVYR